MDALRAGVRDLADVAGRRRLAAAAARARAGRAPPPAIGATGAVTSSCGWPTCAPCSASRLAGRPTRANFRTGTLTVCTMVPMRSVPHRVVCLLGLDDGVFPRAGAVDGDDVLARDPAPASATRAARTGSCCSTRCWPRPSTWSSPTPAPTSAPAPRRPPAVPARRAARRRRPHHGEPGAGGRPHPAPAAALRRAQPQGRRPGRDPRVGRPDLRGPTQRPFSFDGAALPGARPRRPAYAVPCRRCSTGRCPARPAEDVSLADLAVPGAPGPRVPARPARRVDAVRARRAGDAIPVELDALEVWAGRRPAAARACSPARTPAAVMLAEQLRGDAAARRAGRARPCAGRPRSASKLCDRHRRAARRRRRGPSTSTSTWATAAGSTGTVAGVYGNRLVSLGYSRLKAKQRLRTWVDLLALAASRPRRDAGPGTRSAGARRPAARARRAARPARRRLAARPGRAARPRADPSRSRCRSPRPPRGPTTHARAAARCRRRREARPRAGSGRPTGSPATSASFSKEDEDAYHVRVFGPPRRRGVAQSTPAWPTYAWQVWEPLLTGVERVGAAMSTASDGSECLRHPDPLPTGTVLLEASAGTGKTWTIGALVTRYVAEGVARLGADAGRDLRPRRQPGAARTGARPARRGRAGAGRRPGGRAAVAVTSRPSWCGCCSASTATSAGVAPPPGHRRAGRLRRRDHRDHPPVLLAGARLPRRRRRHRLACPPGRGPRRPREGDRRRPLPPRVRLRRGRPGLHLRRGADHRPRGGRRPAGPARAGVARTGHLRRPPGVGSPRAVRTEMDRRKRRLGVLSYDDLLSQLADALADPDGAAPPSGCASAGRSCWSTSSRTPTRCSGRCSTGRSAATPRWC